MLSCCQSKALNGQQCSFIILSQMMLVAYSIRMGISLTYMSDPVFKLNLINLLILTHVTHRQLKSCTMFQKNRRAIKAKNQTNGI